MENRTKYKLVFLGNSFVGKTSIIEQFAYKTFDIKSNPTVGIDFIAKNFTVEGRNIRLLLWDTAGQERFHSLIPSYLRDASCAVIVFDVTSRQSFESIPNWVRDVKQARGSEAVLVVLANKIDCERLISENEARAFCTKLDLLYFEVSAKTGQGIEEAMEAICLAMPSEPSFLVTQSNLNQSQFEQTVASYRKPQKLENNKSNQDNKSLQQQRQQQQQQQQQQCC